MRHSTSEESRPSSETWSVRRRESFRSWPRQEELVCGILDGHLIEPMVPIARNLIAALLVIIFGQFVLQLSYAGLKGSPGMCWAGDLSWGCPRWLELLERVRLELAVDSGTRQVQGALGRAQERVRRM